jgi:hypothetical protein
MTRTIRIDAEVWQWLQRQAEPLEDTPNSVLRRIALLDGHPDKVAQVSGATGASTREAPTLRTRRRGAKPSAFERQYSAAQLAKEWKVSVQHALYHRDGVWYNNLERFPGALFDPNGYVVFETEKDYRDHPQVRVKKQTNVRGGISALPGYVRVR